MTLEDQYICPNCRSPFPVSTQLKKVNGGERRVSYWDSDRNVDVHCQYKDVPDDYTGAVFIEG